jgi:hypothetical protein
MKSRNLLAIGGWKETIELLRCAIFSELELKKIPRYIGALLLRSIAGENYPTRTIGYALYPASQPKWDKNPISHIWQAFGASISQWHCSGKFLRD